MFQRFLSRLTYANLMATLAVFLALGGGLALATIHGNGSVRFGGQRGLPSDHRFVTILDLQGLGKLQAACGATSPNDKVRFKNTSGGRLNATVFDEPNGDFHATPLSNGDTLQTVFAAFDSFDTVRFHVFRAGRRGTPAADIVASHKYGSGCSGNTVAAQALAHG